MSLADDVVTAALNHEGLEAWREDDRWRLEQLIGDPPVGTHWDLRRVSTCALVARGFLRLAGADWPELWQPYVSGTAVSGLVVWAKAQGLWQTDGALHRGDIVLIGRGLREHILTVLEAYPDRVVSIDGGQVRQGWQAVVRVGRGLVGRSLGGRVIRGWVRLF